MIVDCAVYRDGVRLAGDRTPESVAAELATPPPDEPEPGGADHDPAEGERPVPREFAWVGLADPLSSELAQVRRAFDIHPLTIEDALSPRERPKVERIEGTLSMVLRSARYLDAAEEVEFGQITVLLGDDFVVVVRLGDAVNLKGVRRRLETHPERLHYGPAAVLVSILDEVVDAYGPVLDGIENDIDEVETQVFAQGVRPGQPTERLYYLLREVLQTQRATSPVREQVAALMDGDEVPEGAKPYLRDVADHLADVVDRTASARALLSSALEANLTQVSLRQNEDMRKMSAWVSILAVPTMIAGIYGMNFDHMPELDSRYGYPLILGLMALICTALYRGFRRSGWL